MTVDSVIAQTVPASQIIVVDDGSTDNTRATMDALGGSIIALHQDNQGQAAARNAGLAIADGEFIAFLDADDYWKPDFLEVMESFLDTNPKVGAASCLLLKESPSGVDFMLEGHREIAASGASSHVIPDFFNYWGVNDHIRTGSVLFRSSARVACGLQRVDLRISQDLEYWAMLGLNTTWGLVTRPLWVGSSALVAKKTGWRRKYNKRRRLAPTVEAWQRRVAPQLDERQTLGFALVRGRVAASFSLAHVLGGNEDTARAILERYGREMPPAPSTNALRLGHRLGGIAWWLVCTLLNIRDRFK